MLSNVSTILKEMSSLKMQNLYLIKSSPRFVFMLISAYQVVLLVSFIAEFFS